MAEKPISKRRNTEMPIVRIHGIEPEVQQTFIDALVAELEVKIAAIPELGVTEKQVTIFISNDRTKSSAPKELVVYIDLFNNEERTREVKLALSKAVGNVLAQTFPQAAFIECLPQGYNADNEGYWSLRRNLVNIAPFGMGQPGVQSDERIPFYLRQLLGEAVLKEGNPDRETTFYQYVTSLFFYHNEYFLSHLDEALTSMQSLGLADWALQVAKNVASDYRTGVLINTWTRED